MPESLDTMFSTGRSSRKISCDGPFKLTNVVPCPPRPESNHVRAAAAASVQEEECQLTLGTLVPSFCFCSILTFGANIWYDHEKQVSHNPCSETGVFAYLERLGKDGETGDHQGSPAGHSGLELVRLFEGDKTGEVAGNSS